MHCCVAGYSSSACWLFQAGACTDNTMSAGCSADTLSVHMLRIELFLSPCWEVSLSLSLCVWYWPNLTSHQLSSFKKRAIQKMFRCFSFPPNRGWEKGTQTALPGYSNSPRSCPWVPNSFLVHCNSKCMQLMHSYSQDHILYQPFTSWVTVWSYLNSVFMASRLMVTFK